MRILHWAWLAGSCVASVEGAVGRPHNLPVHPSPTLVTAIFSLGARDLPPASRVDAEEQRRQWTAVLAIDLPMAVYTDAAHGALVRKLRGDRPTRVHIVDPDQLARQEIFAAVERIRTDPAWLAQASWLPGSVHATSPTSLPLALTKPLWLYQQAKANPFGSSHLYWIDPAACGAVRDELLRPDVLGRLARRHRRFLLLCAPHEAGPEVHGFEAQALARLAGVERTHWVAHGAFFGGTPQAIEAQASRYSHHLEQTLDQGLLGTEASLLTLQSYADAEHVDLQFTSGDQPLQAFFAHAHAGWPGDIAGARALLPQLAETWVLSFHAPEQLARLLASMEATEPALLRTGRRVLIDNSIQPTYFPAYDALCARYGFECIREGNRGMNGARMRAAELFHRSGRHAMVWFEDDMLLVPESPARTCENGFTRHVHGLASAALGILQRECADYVKLSFSEESRAHHTQDIWWHLEPEVRKHYFPDDQEPPALSVSATRSLAGVGYAVGEPAYSNWPHLITRRATQKIFHEERADPCREMYWAARSFEMLRQGRLRAAVLLASPVEHLRTQHYPSVERVDDQVVEGKPLVAPAVQAMPAVRRGWPLQPGTIFVSIANYRDSETSHTLRDLFASAAHPERVFAGVFSQVVPGDDDDCLADARPHGAPAGHVRELRVHASESLGACWARSRVLEELLQGEEFVLQIDSHSRFEPGWDETLLALLRQCPSPRALLSAYPPRYELPDTRHPAPPSGIAANIWDKSGILILQARVWDADHLPTGPVAGAFIAAGCLFGPAAAFREVPYDPHLYFHGEEVSMAVRFWTHGWDVFAPARNVLYHDYSSDRGRPRNWNDRRDWKALNRRSFARVRHLLGIEVSRDAEVLREIDRYGLGTARSLREFQAFADVDFARQQIGPRGRDGRFPEPPAAATLAMQRAARERYLDMLPDAEEDVRPPRETRSGRASTLHATRELRDRLAKWLRAEGIRSLADAGCGDFHWLQEVDLGGLDLYVGYDIVPELIARNQELYGNRRGHFFTVADIARAPIAAVDAILCRRVLCEMPQDEAVQALANFRASGARFLLATTRVLPGKDAPRYRDLFNPPFGLPMPVQLIPDGNGAALGIWAWKAGSSS